MSNIDTDVPEPSNRNRLEQRTVRDAKNWLSGLAATVAAASLAAALTQVVGNTGDIDLFGSRSSAEVRRQLDTELVGQIRSLRSEVAALKSVQASIGQLPASERISIQNAAIRSRVEGVEQRQFRLEQAISNTPEKALALPMMRRDIDSLRDSNTQSMAAIRQSVDQVYDLTKWLLGALAIGVLSLAIANFLTRK